MKINFGEAELYILNRNPFLRLGDIKEWDNDVVEFRLMRDMGRYDDQRMVEHYYRVNLVSGMYSDGYLDSRGNEIELTSHLINS